MTVRVVDDRSRELRLAAPPRRVVSLVPSDTLNVAALGCLDRVVARTDYCVLPEGVSAIPSVGGTKNPRVDGILALEPDLVLANQEENTRSDLEALARAGIPVLVAFPKTVLQGIAHLARLARALHVDRIPAVVDLLARAYRAVSDAERSVDKRRKVKAFCPIWMKPLMTINGETFVSDMMRLIGADNVFASRQRRYPLSADLGRSHKSVAAEGRDTRYPRIAVEEVIERAPQLILLPDEPHPFSPEDAEFFRQLPIPATVIHIDGKDLSWYGARSLEALARLTQTVTSRETTR